MKTRRHKRIRLGLLGLAAAVAAAAVTSTASAHMSKTITIRHQLRGCHTWSFANGPYKASLKIEVDRDTTLAVVDDDVMPHKLIQTAGRKAILATPAMRHMGARALISFRARGVYAFTTKAGEDYVPGIKTVGPDNVLRLTVTVT